MKRLIIILSLMSVSSAKPQEVTATIDRIEPYHWKFDDSTGFKVFVTVKGQMPDTTRLIIFSGLLGWDILRGDDEQEEQRGRPIMSRNVDFNEFIIRWKDEDVTKQESIGLSFWFHKSRDESTARSMPPNEILWGSHLDLVRKLLRIDVPARNIHARSKPAS